jgi:hypothetical protein
VPRLVSAVLVCLLAVAPSAYAKRRAAKSPSNPSAQQCVTFGFVRTGLSADYLTTTPQGNVTFTITYLQDDASITRTTQHVQTPQASADAETTINTQNGPGALRGIKHIYVKTTTVVPVLGAQVIETDIDFVPTLTQGPSGGWCVGAKWTVPAVTETLVSKSIAGTQSQIVTTLASEGEVLGLETITVPAGTFQTLKYRGALVSSGNVQIATTWVSTQHNVVVRQEAGDQVTVMTALR